MTKIYGYSDDNVVFERDTRFLDEVGCFDKDVRIKFTDGTVIRVGYPKKDLAVWWIEIEEKGTAPYVFIPCEDEDAEIYSDIFEIDAEVESYSVIKQGGN